MPSDSSPFMGPYVLNSVDESGIASVAPNDFSTYPPQIQPYGNQPQRAPSTSGTSAFTAVGAVEHLGTSYIAH